MTLRGGNVNHRCRALFRSQAFTSGYCLNQSVGRPRHSQKAKPFPPTGILRARVAPRLRPTDARCEYMGGEDLARSCLAYHLFKTMPLSRHHEQRLPVPASKHAREAAAIKLDAL